jgi:hypothetical protein
MTFPVYVALHWPRPGQPTLAGWVLATPHGVACGFPSGSRRVGYRPGIPERKAYHQISRDGLGSGGAFTFIIIGGRRFPPPLKEKVPSPQFYGFL